MLVVSILHDAYHARAATQLEKVHNDATTAEPIHQHGHIFCPHRKQMGRTSAYHD